MELIIIYTRIAKEDLKDIHNYIKRNSRKYAGIEIKSIRFNIQKLKINPLLGKKFAKLDDDSTRELIYKNYRIIYEVAVDQINILTIHHHSRLISNNAAFDGA